MYYIDGQQVGNFEGFQVVAPSTQNTSNGINRVIYSNDTLSQGAHVFLLQNGHQGGDPSMIYFDYLVYSAYVRPLIMTNRSHCHVLFF